MNHLEPCRSISDHNRRRDQKISQSSQCHIDGLDLRQPERRMAWKTLTAFTAATIVTRKLLKARKRKQQKGSSSFCRPFSKPAFLLHDLVDEFCSSATHFDELFRELNLPYCWASLTQSPLLNSLIPFIKNKNIAHLGSEQDRLPTGASTQETREGPRNHKQPKEGKNVTGKSFPVLCQLNLHTAPGLVRQDVIRPGRAWADNI